MPIVVTSNQPSSPAAPTKVEPVVQEVVEKTPAAEATPPAEIVEASGASNETETETEAKEKPSKGVQQRFDKLTKQRKDAERETEFWKSEALKAKAPEKSAPAQTTAPVAAAGEPDPNEFTTNADYLKALTKFEIQQDKKAEETKAESLKTREREVKATEKLKTSIDSFKATHTDFDDVVTDEFQVPPALGRAILESEEPAQLMYELCKNREAYDKIVALPENQLIRALGRFEAKFEAPATAAASEEKAEIPEKPASKAPQPITPVGNKGTGAGKKSIHDPNITQGEYEALRAEQRKNRSSAWG